MEWPLPNKRMFRETLFLLMLSIFNCALATAYGSEPPRAQTFHSDRHGYSLSIPPGWKEVPSKDYNDLISRLQGEKAATTVSYDAAFRFDKTETETPWNYPYVLIQVIRYAEMGLDRQPTEAELSKMMEGMNPAANADIQGNIDDNVSDEYRDLAAR